MSTTSSDVEAAAANYAKQQSEADSAREAMNETIRAAITDGVPVREIVTATGLTKQRVYQIRDRTR